MDTPKQTVIKVMGVGGAGSNAVNRMIELGLEGVDFIAANTDAQALTQSQAPTRLQLGPRVTRGLGAGGNPAYGEAAAEESRAEIKRALSGADMVFLTAGMGGGTGTGAAPVAAEVARSTGALTIAVVSTPFAFEGGRRHANAEAGLARLRPQADTVISVPNERLFSLLGEHTQLDVALRVADDVLRQGVQGIAELVSRPGLINVDFAHIQSLMKLAGGAMMAIGQGRGENKTVDAVRQALRMPLLDIHSIEAAAGVLVHFTGGDDLGLLEISQAAEEVNRAAPRAEVIFGATIDPLMNGRAQAIVFATGLAAQAVEPPVRTAAVRQTAPAASASQTGALLAATMFHQALEPDPLERPWVVSDPGGPDLNDPDMPAFLRRRRSLRDMERRQ